MYPAARRAVGEICFLLLAARQIRHRVREGLQGLFQPPPSQNCFRKGSLPLRQKRTRSRRSELRQRNTSSFQFLISHSFLKASSNCPRTATVTASQVQISPVMNTALIVTAREISGNRAVAAAKLGMTA